MLRRSQSLRVIERFTTTSSSPLFAFALLGTMVLVACGEDKATRSHSALDGGAVGSNPPSELTSSGDTVSETTLGNVDLSGSSATSARPASDDELTAESDSASAAPSTTPLEASGSSAPRATTDSGERGTTDNTPSGSGFTENTSSDAETAGDDTQYVEIPPPGSAVVSPPGCSDVTHSPAESPGDFCGYFLSCGDSLTIAATIDPAGVEWHNCSHFGESYRFRLTGVTGLDACSVGANLCIAFDGSTTSTETCAIVRPVQDESGCAAELRCTNPVELGYGVTATIDGGASKLSCSWSGEGRWGCGCQERDGSTRSWLVGAVSSGEACGALESVCLAGEPVTLSEDRQCAESSPLEAWDFGCSIALDCTRAATPSPSGAVIQVPEENTGSCSDRDGAWDCQCTAGNTAYRYQPEIKTTPEEACLDAVQVCRTGLVATGAATCSSESLAQGETSCLRSFSCSQPAVSASLTVSRISTGSVECQRTNSGWRCPCYGGDEVAFRYDSQWGSEAACEAAVLDCSAHLAL